MSTRTSGMRGTAAPGVPVPQASERLLDARLADWVQGGIISPEQADLIAARERTRPAPPATTHGSLVAEALGYLGGLVVLVAAILLANDFWDDLGTSGRLIVVGAASLTLLGAGMAVPDRAAETGRRLRAVLWACTAIALAGFLGLLTTDALDLSGDHAALVTSAGTAAGAATLWAVRRTVLQQVVALVGLAATAASMIAQVDDAGHLPGAGVWAVGVVWFLLGWGGVLKPRRAVLALGAATAIAGTLITLPTDPGITFALLTVAAVVVCSILLRDLILLAVGVVGFLQVMPAMVEAWFGDTLVAPFALLAAGLLLIAAGLWIARRRHEQEARPAAPYTRGTRRAAVAAAAAVLLGVTGYVVVVAVL